MFTGLIEATGRVADTQHTGTGLRLRIDSRLAGELRQGDSVAVSGVCLTVRTSTAEWFDADIGPETVRVTTLGSLSPGAVVNLERSMRADGRFGGHFVLGHVDGTGRLTEVREEGGARWLTVSFGRPLAPLFIPKGSVALDGISLTVAALGQSTFQVMIVPHTWEQTNLRELGPGDRVNLECDVIGKYVARAAELLTGNA